MTRKKQVAVVHDTMPAPQEPSSTAVSMLSMIERAARDPSVDVAKLERLFELQERFMAREAQAAYANDLARMQPELPMIAEKGWIKNKAGQNTISYALWEDIVGEITPILSKYGFSLSFRTEGFEGGIRVTGVLTHRMGHSEQTTLPLPVDNSGSKNSVQAIGSSTAYGKRYTAAALLNLRTGGEDDDGEAGGTEFITEEQVADLRALMQEVEADEAKFCIYMRVESLENIPADQFNRAVKALEAKRA